MKVDAETIILEWVEDGNFSRKKVSRKDLVENMKQLKKDLDDNFFISLQLCDVLPKTIIIHINKDKNSELDVPVIICQTPNACRGIGIMRDHKRIWELIDQYCN